MKESLLGSILDYSFSFSLKTQCSSPNFFHLSNGRQSLAKAVYSHPEAADIFVKSISQQGLAALMTF